ncbi:MAG TPA: hypothetical protein VG797_10410, partial [Phycisphaerales bacterium]|nr:hypothetical protein [Phycisphaerales bacterium]
MRIQAAHAAIRPVVVASLLSAVVSSAQAQWTVTVLHPAGATSSQALGVSGGQQVGNAGVAFLAHASLWNGTSGSWIDLHNPS